MKGPFLNPIFVYRCFITDLLMQHKCPDELEDGEQENQEHDRQLQGKQASSKPYPQDNSHKPQKQIWPIID